MSEKPFSNSWDDELPIDRKARLDKCIAGMMLASNQFYLEAVRLQNHTFIEFTGLINEYIKVCRQNADQGIDFTRLSAHGGRTLELKDYEIEYLQEKLTCIYGPQWKTNLREMNPAEQSLLKRRRAMRQMVDDAQEDGTYEK